MTYATKRLKILLPAKIHSHDEVMPVAFERPDLVDVIHFQHPNVFIPFIALSAFPVELVDRLPVFRVTNEDLFARSTQTLSSSPARNRSFSQDFY
jgi:hypothetical protein